MLFRTSIFAYFFMPCLVMAPNLFSQTKFDPKKIMQQTESLPPASPDLCLAEGKEAPDFSIQLVGKEKKLWNLKDALQSGPVVMVFYRGGWCPYCNVQLQQYKNEYSKLSAQKASMIAISSDLADKTLLKKPTPPMPFPIGSDPKLKVISQYNLKHEIDENLVKKYLGYGIDLEKASGETHHTISVPAIVIVDQSRRVRWCYANLDYKIRPAMSVLAQKLKGVNGPPSK